MRIEAKLLPLAGLCATLCLPLIASAKGPSTEETVAAAKASKLFKRELKRDQLQAAGFAELTVSPGVKMDFARWIKDTALDTRPETAPLFGKLPAGLIKGAPVYSEKIYELEDRLIVDRKLTVALAPGACDQANKPQAVTDLCFTKNPNANGKSAPGVAKELAAVRAKLVKAPAEQVVRGTVTAAQALKMTDDLLLDLLINSDERTVQQVSIVPRQAVAPKSGFDKFGGKLEPLVADTGLEVYTPGVPGPKVDVGGIFTPDRTFAREYFLTGFTYGKEIEDSWEYTFANETWFTDRYYVRVAYHVGLGFGVRAPFSVDVKSSAVGNNGRNIQMSVAPVNVDSNGLPAYPAVGLPANKTFGGKEFVLEFKASCSLYVSIPGPNIDKKCPTIDLDYSRDINPVIGNESSSIGDWWLDGTVTGLSVNLAAASVSLDVGIGADVTNGSVGMRLSPLAGSSFAGINAGDLSLTNRNPIGFTVNRTPGTPNAGFRLERPSYAFDIRVMPKLRAKVKVDVAVYEKTWMLGPYALDFLSIARTFQLSHHAGTVAQHDYPVFVNNDPGMSLDPSPDSPPPPPPPKTPKKFPQKLDPSPLLQK